MAVTCRECNLEVGSRAALVAHWEEKRELDQRHYHCEQCMQLFHTPEAEDRHHREFHPAKQDLACPGCNERFVAASGLIAHIEKNRCKTVKNDDYADRREEKLAFARELQRREYQDPDRPDDLSVAGLSLAESTTTKNGLRNFTRYLSRAKDVEMGTPGLSSLRPMVENAVQPKLANSAADEVEFPQLAGKQTDLLTGGPGDSAKKRPANAWAQGKKLFTDAPPPVRPPSENRGAAQQPAETKQPEWLEHDPRNPGWDPKKYFVPSLDKYKCPHDRCPKSFPREGGLRAHLLSASHTSLIKVQCPRCSKWFDSMAALTAHAESQSVRCDLRETNGYRHFLDQLTAGMVDTAGRHDDGTKKYTVPDTARQFFGTSQGKWAAEQRRQQGD